MVRTVRASPYTSEDKKLLVQLIKKHPIIENKKTDAQTIYKKQKAWIEVLRAYNLQAITGPRTVVQLKKCFDKIKRSYKAVVGTERRERVATEDGPVSLKEEEVQVLDEPISAPDVHFELSSEFDSDAVHLEPGPSSHSVEKQDNTCKKTDITIEKKSKKTSHIYEQLIGQLNETHNLAKIDFELKKERHHLEMEVLEMQVKYWTNKCEQLERELNK